MQTSNVWWAKPLPQTSRPPHNPTHGGQQGTQHRARARVRDNNSHRYKTWSTSVRFRLSPSKKNVTYAWLHIRAYSNTKKSKNLGCKTLSTHLAATAPKIVLSIHQLMWNLTKKIKYFGTFGNINIITFLQKHTHTQLLTSKLLAYFE
jgi:hypothetical protein